MSDRGTADERSARRLTARVNELEQELRMLAQSMPSDEPEPTPEDQGAAQRDARWHCNKCGYLLAFYDVASDVLRTRYKEHIVYMRLGQGGFVQIVCRGCSEVNTQQYVEGEDAQAQSGD